MGGVPVGVGIFGGVGEVFFAGAEESVAQLRVGELGSQQAADEGGAFVFPFALHAGAEAVVEVFGGVEGEGDAGEGLAVEVDSGGGIARVAGGVSVTRGERCSRVGGGPEEVGGRLGERVVERRAGGGRGDVAWGLAQLQCL